MINAPSSPLLYSLCQADVAGEFRAILGMFLSRRFGLSRLACRKIAVAFLAILPARDTFAGAQLYHRIHRLPSLIRMSRTTSSLVVTCALRSDVLYGATIESKSSDRTCVGDVVLSDYLGAILFVK